MIILYGFFILDLIGTILLSHPLATKEPNSSDFIVSLFTATSAITVTGLTLVDTFTHWSFFGQLVIIILCFLGGLGFKESQFHMPFNSFSGGWRMRCILAGILLRKPNYLFFGSFCGYCTLDVAQYFCGMSLFRLVWMSLG